MKQYEAAVQNGAVSGLSKLMPLLGMLNIAEMSMKMYAISL